MLHHSNADTGRDHAILYAGEASASGMDLNGDGSIDILNVLQVIRTAENALDQMGRHDNTHPPGGRDHRPRRLT